MNERISGSVGRATLSTIGQPGPARRQQPLGPMRMSGRGTDVAAQQDWPEDVLTRTSGLRQRSRDRQGPRGVRPSPSPSHELPSPPIERSTSLLAIVVARSPPERGARQVLDAVDRKLQRSDHARGTFRATLRRHLVREIPHHPSGDRILSVQGVRASGGHSNGPLSSLQLG